MKKVSLTGQSLEDRINELEVEIAMLQEELDRKEDDLYQLRELSLELDKKPLEEVIEDIEAENAYKRGMLRLTKYYGKIPQSIADMKWWEVPLY